MTDEAELRSLAIRRADMKLGFRMHLLVYAAVNGGLLAINLLTNPYHLWFYWPMIGWGIGLALARRVVEDAHRGAVVLEPTEKGASFVIRLRRAATAGSRSGPRNFAGRCKLPSVLSTTPGARRAAQGR